MAINNEYLLGLHRKLITKNDDKFNVKNKELNSGRPDWGPRNFIRHSSFPLFIFCDLFNLIFIDSEFFQFFFLNSIKRFKRHFCSHLSNIFDNLFKFRKLSFFCAAEEFGQPDLKEHTVI